jgi:Zn-dependent protease
MDSELSARIAQGAVYLVALVLSVCVHEFGHAFVADRLGDRLPRAQGRVTLNPLAHIDPIGTLLLPVMAMIVSISSPGVGQRMIAWGKPVRISLAARDIRRGVSLKTAHALIAFAGPAMNILFALVMSAVYAAMVHYESAERMALQNGVADLIFMNLGLCIFNLLPIPPLDGAALLERLAPRRAEPLVQKLNQYGFFIFFALIMVPFRGGTLLSWILSPAYGVAEAWIELVHRWAAV